MAAAAAAAAVAERNHQVSVLHEWILSNAVQQMK
jgi:hypothetical protein